MHSVVDRQLQCYCILTSLRIGRDIIIATTGSIRESCSCCPCIRSACSLRIKCMCSVVDRQLQRHCILAPLCICGDVIIGTTGSIRESCSCCPCIRNTCSLRTKCMSAV